MPIRQRIVKPARKLEAWYSSEHAKRSLGWLCQTVNEDGKKVGLLGSPEEPLLFLEDVDTCEVEILHEHITIEDARTNWPAITTAAAVLGTIFRLDGKKRPRAVIYANKLTPHPALKYRHSQSSDFERISEQLEEITREIRRLRRADSKNYPNLALICERLDTSSELINRRFIEIWRASNGFHPEYNNPIDTKISTPPQMSDRKLWSPPGVSRP